MLERLLPSREVPKESLGVDIRQYAVVTDVTGRLLVLQFPAHYKGDARNCSWVILLSIERGEQPMTTAAWS